MELPLSHSYNFAIKDRGEISGIFLKKAVRDFSEAQAFIKHLPYGRNANKKDLTRVFTDACGTCSTKHALLKLLAIEQDRPEIKLMLGIFKMSGHNTPQIAHVLGKYGLAYIPEAHNYLRIAGEVSDCTTRHSCAADFENELFTEQEIMPDQITDFKTEMHKRFIEHWLIKNATIPYLPVQLWDIREQCIAALSEAKT